MRTTNVMETRNHTDERAESLAGLMVATISFTVLLVIIVSFSAMLLAELHVKYPILVGPFPLWQVWLIVGIPIVVAEVAIGIYCIWKKVVRG